ncbi:MAG: PspC domain-containing protein [Bacteroidales bacterium]|nr:PspC domain-containing protein [Bacteroidales bacterium]
MIVMKKLYRSKNDKKIAGVCGGLAEYLNVDSTIIRLIWLACILLCGFGLLLYAIAWIVMPDEPEKQPENQVDEQ